MSEEQTREPDQSHDDQSDEQEARTPLEDPGAELHESDAGSEHLPGESYQNTFRLN